MSTYVALQCPGTAPKARLKCPIGVRVQRDGERVPHRWGTTENPSNASKGACCGRTVSSDGKLVPVTRVGRIVIDVMNPAMCKHGSERVRGTQIDITQM